MDADSHLHKKLADQDLHCFKGICNVLINYAHSGHIRLMHT